jgi:hypothetical protein
MKNIGRLIAIINVGTKYDKATLAYRLPCLFAFFNIPISKSSKILMKIANNERIKVMSP